MTFESIHDVSVYFKKNNLTLQILRHLAHFVQM